MTLEHLQGLCNYAVMVIEKHIPTMTGLIKIKAIMADDHKDGSTCAGINVAYPTSYINVNLEPIETEFDAFADLSHEIAHALLYRYDNMMAIVKRLMPEQNHEALAMLDRQAAEACALVLAPIIHYLLDAERKSVDTVEDYHA